MEDRDNEVLAERLIAAGFLEGLENETAQLLESELRRSVWTFTDHPWRVFMADDEEIAERGALVVLNRLAPALRHLGVPQFLGEEIDTGDDSYVISVPGGTVTLMTQFEADLEFRREFRGLAWGLVPARLYKAFNQHLERAGKSDRLYCLGGGNDGFVLLLTPAMFEIVRVFPGAQWERPYLRTETWPHFGHPH